MARRVFFSFHYDRDNWRVSQVRNSWLTRRGASAPPFYDHADWEEVKRTGRVQAWIDEQLIGSSVTAVLIGAETASRRWVRYEIERSVALGKGLLGIYIHNLKDRHGYTDVQGANPLPRGYPTYDWVYDDGYRNIESWVEQAWRRAGR